MSLSLSFPICKIGIATGKVVKIFKSWGKISSVEQKCLVLVRF